MTLYATTRPDAFMRLWFMLQKKIKDKEENCLFVIQNFTVFRTIGPNSA